MSRVRRRDESQVGEARVYDPAPVSAREPGRAGGGVPSAVSELMMRLQGAGGNQMVVRLLASARSAGREPDSELADRIRAQLGRGEQLPDGLRAEAQAGLGQRLGDVRLHRDTQAAALAGDLSARAFTTGQDVFFGQGEYDPSTPSGFELITHELAHTLQQGSGGVEGRQAAPDLTISNPADRDEQAAAAVARRATRDLQTGKAQPGMANDRADADPAGPAGSTVQRDLVVQRDLAAYTREHLEVMPSYGEGPPVMETYTADAPGIAAATGPLVGAGKVNVRTVQDMQQFSGTGATRDEVANAFAAGSYPRAGQMADALLDPHRIAVYSREEVTTIPGLIWDTTLGRRQQALDTMTTRGLTGAERAAAMSVYGGSIDYDHIVLDDAPVMAVGGDARATPWTLNFPSGTLAGGGPDMSWLIHELGHSWQYQRGVSMATTAYHAVRGIYDYGGEEALRRVTASGRGLSAFNTEQQGDIACHAYEIMNHIRPGDITVYQPYLDEFRSGRYR
jgi:hypothetical protein